MKRTPNEMHYNFSILQQPFNCINRRQFTMYDLKTSTDRWDTIQSRALNVDHFYKYGSLLSTINARARSRDIHAIYIRVVTNYS